MLSPVLSCLHSCKPLLKYLANNAKASSKLHHGSPERQRPAACAYERHSHHTPWQPGVPSEGGRGARQPPTGEELTHLQRGVPDAVADAVAQPVAYMMHHSACFIHAHNVGASCDGLQVCVSTHRGRPAPPAGRAGSGGRTAAGPPGPPSASPPPGSPGRGNLEATRGGLLGSAAPGRVALSRGSGTPRGPLLLGPDGCLRMCVQWSGAGAAGGWWAPGVGGAPGCVSMPAARSGDGASSTPAAPPLVPLDSALPLQPVLCPAPGPVCSRGSGTILRLDVILGSAQGCLGSTCISLCGWKGVLLSFSLSGMMGRFLSMPP